MRPPEGVTELHVADVLLRHTNIGLFTQLRLLRTHQKHNLHREAELRGLSLITRPRFMIERANDFHPREDILILRSKVWAAPLKEVTPR